MPGNAKPVEMRRLNLVVPCLVVSLLLTTWMSSGETERYGRKVALDTRTLPSAMSGPLACWTEGVGAEQRVFCTILALVLAPGILCHPLRPGRATAVGTILASTVWFVFGNAITHIGF